eukprot:219502-Pelagomonas_calceolata.AAC.1
MYAGQVWGTEYIKAGKEFASDIQVRHMNYLKSTLGVKRATTNWAVLRECGHEPLQFYWFRTIVKMYNSMLRSKSEALRRVLKADLNIHSREPFCWTAQVSDAFQGLRRCDYFVQAVWQGAPIPIQEFIDDLRHRLQAVWRDVERVSPRETYSKLAIAIHQSLFAVPFDHNVRAPSRLPRHMHLDLSPH